jgi:hypothetical protein
MSFYTHKGKHTMLKKIKNALVFTWEVIVESRRLSAEYRIKHGGYYY